MTRINIAVDIDNTLANTQEAIINYVEHKSGKKIDRSRLETELRDNEEQWYGAYTKQFIYSTDYINTVHTIKPYKTSLSALAVLGSHGAIYLVSSRINNWHEPTIKWLDEYNLTGSLSGVYLRDQSEGSLTYKRRIFTELDIHYIFDDSIDIAFGVRDIAKRVFLINQPWNAQRKIHDSGIISRYMDLYSAAKSLEKSLLIY